MGLLLVPFYSYYYYWAFHVFPGFATDYNAFADRPGGRGDPALVGTLRGLAADDDWLGPRGDRLLRRRHRLPARTRDVSVPAFRSDAVHFPGMMIMFVTLWQICEAINAVATAGRPSGAGEARPAGE